MVQRDILASYSSENVPKSKSFSLIPFLVSFRRSASVPVTCFGFLMAGLMAALDAFALAMH